MGARSLWSQVLLVLLLSWEVTRAKLDGARPESKRSLEWIRQFSVETVKAGFGAPSFYEWHISTMAE